VAVAGIGVDDRDHPVGGDLAGDPEAGVVTALQVLAGHRGQQPGGFGHRRGERAAGKHSQQRVGISGARIHQGPGRLVVPVDLRLGRRGILVPAGQDPSQLDLQPPLSHPEQARMAAPSNVTVSIVATASYNGVESSTRRTPTSPPCLAAATVTAKIRSGRAEAASRPACPPARYG
jgi:hypothetical protein